MSNFLQGYQKHVDERAAQGVVPNLAVHNKPPIWWNYLKSPSR